MSKTTHISTTQQTPSLFIHCVFRRPSSISNSQFVLIYVVVRA